MRRDRVAVSHGFTIIEHMFDPPHVKTAASLESVTARAADVAASLRSRLAGSGEVKVHKLLYYVQGHHLAWHGRPAFVETIEAWVNGPVVADLWRSEKYEPPAEPAAIDNDVLEVVCMVASRYGHLTGKDLIKLSHNEDPWRDLSESDEATTGALAGSDLKLDNSFGVAAQIGADFAINDKWAINVDLRWADIDTDAALDGAPLGTVAIDPFVFGVAVAYKF